MKQPLLSSAEIRAELVHTEALFADIRAKFTGPGIERGGHERPGVVPVYVKKYGEYTSILYPNVQRFSVESSFSEAQLQYVNAALLALKEGVIGEVGQPARNDHLDHCDGREFRTVETFDIVEGRCSSLRSCLKSLS